MKKVYLTLLTVLTMVFTMNAQYEFDFEFFALGDAAGQEPEVILWPDPTVTSSQITEDEAFSGTKSMVTREQGGGIIDDVLMKLGNQTTGVWSVSWMMYVPTGKTGFWNIQNADDFTSTADAQWNGQFFVGATASGGNVGEITFDQDPGVSVPYPSDQWFNVTHVVDMDNGTHTLSIDGNLLLDEIQYLDTDGIPASQLGAINYFAIDGNNRYYVDDFTFQSGNVLSNNDFSVENFRIYPNPVRDVLNIQTAATVDAVVVYDVLGKVVLQAQPDAVSPTIDMGNLSSGAYMVQVTIGDATKTVKVVK